MRKHRRDPSIDLNTADAVGGAEASRHCSNERQDVLTRRSKRRRITTTSSSGNTAMQIKAIARDDQEEDQCHSERLAPLPPLGLTPHLAAGHGSQDEDQMVMMMMANRTPKRTRAWTPRVYGRADATLDQRFCQTVLASPMISQEQQQMLLYRQQIANLMTPNLTAAVTSADLMHVDPHDGVAVPPIMSAARALATSSPQVDGEYELRKLEQMDPLHAAEVPSDADAEHDGFPETLPRSQSWLTEHQAASVSQQPGLDQCAPTSQPYHQHGHDHHDHQQHHLLQHQQQQQQHQRGVDAAALRQRQGHRPVPPIPPPRPSRSSSIANELMRTQPECCKDGSVAIFDADATHVTSTDSVGAATSTAETSSAAASAEQANVPQTQVYAYEFRADEARSAGMGMSASKQRLVWTTELHQLFIKAILDLGLDKAVPRLILRHMAVAGLKRENVSSHLQKYRLALRRLLHLSKNAPIPSDVPRDVIEKVALPLAPSRDASLVLRRTQHVATVGGSVSELPPLPGVATVSPAVTAASASAAASATANCSISTQVTPGIYATGPALIPDHLRGSARQQQITLYQQQTSPTPAGRSLLFPNRRV